MKLGTKIIFLITASLAGLGILSSLLVYDIMLDVLKKDLMKKSVTIARTLAKGIARDVIGNEAVLVHEYLRSMVAQTSDLEYVFVAGFENELFAHSFEGGFPPDLYIQKHNTENFIRYLDTGKGPVMEICAPLIKNLTAHVHIGLNESSLYAQAKALRNRILLLTLIMVLIAVLITVIVSRRITRPLGRLVDSMREYGNKGTIGQLKISSGGMEVKKLAVTFQEMIQELEQSSKALQEANDIINMSPAVAFLWKNEEGWPVEYVTDNVLELFGYTAREMTSGTVSYAELVHPEDIKTIANELARFSSMEPCEDFVREPYRIIAKDGTVKWLDDHTHIRRDEQGNITHYHGIVIDITNRKKVENALKKSEEQHRTLLYSIPQKIFYKNKDSVYISCNKHYANDLKIAPEDIAGKSDFDFYPKELAEKYQNDDKGIIASGKTEDMDEKYINDEQEYWIQIIKTPIKGSDSTVTGILGIFWDIADRKVAAEKIKASLKEKIMLLKEIHHRVKNNMQIITSLLRLQSDNIKDDHDLDMFKESQMRIQSMALIHDKLYQSDDLTCIGFSEYLKELSTTLVRTYALNPGAVTVTVEAADVSLGLDTAIPCGLLVNELVSNSLKHAFPDDRKGEISVTLQPVEDDQAALTVSDNGIGLPDDLDIRNTKSLGMELVVILAEGQLNGSLEVDRTDGTAFRVVFKNV